MAIVGAVVLGVVLFGVVVGAAAWDRSHGRKDENWDRWDTMPAWAYLWLAVSDAAMIVVFAAAGSWIGVAFGVLLAVDLGRRYRRQRTASPPAG